MTKRNAWKIEFFKLSDPNIRIDERRSVQFKNSCRPATLAEFSTLDVYRCGESDACINRRNIWAWQDPWQAGAFEIIITLPTLHHHDLKFAANTEMLVEHFRQLAGRHPVPCRYLKLADKRGERGLGDIALDLDATNRIRAVADDDPLAEFRSRTHAIRHCIDKCVDTAADVLHVKNYDI